MRIIKKWIGRKPESAGDVYLLEVTQAEMFEQMYPLLGQLALHATSGRDVDYRLYFICEYVKTGGGYCRWISRAS